MRLSRSEERALRRVVARLEEALEAVGPSTAYENPVNEFGGVSSGYLQALEAERGLKHARCLLTSFGRDPERR